MMKYLSSALCIILFTITYCTTPDTYFADALCIDNISVIDPELGLIEHQTVIIKEGKILQVLSSDQVNLSSKNKIIDGTDKFLIPGLWDAHVHFAYIEEIAPRMFDLFLAYGITSVRDTGGEIHFTSAWKKKSLKNPTSSPRVMIAGPLLDGMPNVYDGSDHEHPPLSVGLATISDVQNKVNELDSMGVDLLKAYEMLSPNQFEEIMRLGQEKGLKVTGHVPLSMDVISASNAGLNSMEHMRNLELSCANNSDELLEQRQEILAMGKQDIGGILRSKIHELQRPLAIANYDPQRAQEVLAVLARNETWQIPTLALTTGFTERPFASSEWQETFKYLPEVIELNWKREIDELMTKTPTPFNEKYTEWLTNMVGQVHRNDIEIMAGTDCPIFYLTPGRSLHEELEVLVKAGLSPLEALQTATTNPAKYFNLENELGSVKKTMWADLIILDENPLNDIRNTQKINAVIKQGHYLERSDLDEMLKKLAIR